MKNLYLIIVILNLIACTNHSERKTDAIADSIIVTPEREPLVNHDIIETISFERGSYMIQSKDSMRLNAIAEQWNEKGFLKIFGYTDTVGTDEHNDLISEKRATEVFNYLKKRCSRKGAESYVGWLGESADVYDLHFEQAHAQQNCVDVWLIRWGSK